MSEAAREMTYDEQIANFVIYILAIETPFNVKRDLIGHLLSLTHRYERDIKDALYTQMPSCTIKPKEERDDSGVPVKLLEKSSEWQKGYDDGWSDGYDNGLIDAKESIDSMKIHKGGD